MYNTGVLRNFRIRALLGTAAGLLLFGEASCSLSRDLDSYGAQYGWPSADASTSDVSSDGSDGWPSGDSSAETSTGGGGAGGSGTGGTAAGGGGAGGSAGSGGCPLASQKDCGGSCVSTTDPAYGCAAPDCTPCSLDHAVAACDTASGSCTLDHCVAGWADCDSNDANGCERDVTQATDCGSCDYDCAAALHVVDGQCVNGVCQGSDCEVGRMDCDSNAANGCETVADDSHCSNCADVCAPDFRCEPSGTYNHTCQCSAHAACAPGTCVLDRCNCPLPDGGIKVCGAAKTCGPDGTCVD